GCLCQARRGAAQAEETDEEELPHKRESSAMIRSRQSGSGEVRSQKSEVRGRNALLFAFYLRPGEQAGVNLRCWPMTQLASAGSVMCLPDGSLRLWYAGRRQPPWSNLYFAIGTAHWSGPAK